MTTIINASHFHTTHLKQNLTAYCASKNLHVPIHSLTDALKPDYWRNNLNPFACVIVDQQRNEIVLVRDHWGVQPLYYWYQSDTLIFGNTLPDILHHLPSTPPLLDSQLLNFFSDRNTYSDETLYQGIYRVEPGHLLHMKANGQCHKKAFWQLEREGEELHYQDDNDYLDHFSALLSEAVHVATHDEPNVAAEFSAGMDSSAIYCAAAQQGLKPALFMHTAIPGSQSANLYNDHYETLFLKHYQITNLHRIGADHFDPIKVFQEYATWFAGPAPHIFYMFAHNLHRAVSDNGYSILLSGLGGDQGVSDPAPTRFILPSLIGQKKYRHAWQILTESSPKNNHSPRQLRNHLMQFIKQTHPLMHQIIHRLEELSRTTKNIFKSHDQRSPPPTHPYSTDYFSSLREAEWAFLQGPFNYDIRMRIEYSSIVTQKMGFQYRYPLLYPKLLEFFLNVPITQKRQHGVGRVLMRRYLAQQLGSGLFNQYQKREGLAILAATFDQFKHDYEQGKFRGDFKQGRYFKLTRHKHPYMEMINQIKVFMLEH